MTNLHANKSGTAQFVGNGSEITITPSGSKFVAYVGGGILRNEAGMVCKYKSEDSARRAAAKAIRAAN